MRRSCFSAAPSIITQPLPTTTTNHHQATMANTPAVTTIPSKTAKAPGQDRLVCSLCNKVYRSSAGLRYHKRKRHRGTHVDELADHLYILHVDEGMLKPSQLHRVRCLEAGCNYQMLAISDLRNHLANHHLKPAYKTTEEKKFNSFAGKSAGHHLVRRLNSSFLSVQSSPNGNQNSSRAVARST